MGVVRGSPALGLDACPGQRQLPRPSCREGRGLHGRQQRRGEGGPEPVDAGELVGCGCGCGDVYHGRGVGDIIRYTHPPRSEASLYPWLILV